MKNVQLIINREYCCCENRILFIVSLLLFLIPFYFEVGYRRTLRNFR